jgi:hypothetical protein
MLVGCEIFGPADAEPASIEVYPSELSLSPGDTARLDYIVRDRLGRELKGVSVQWKVPSNKVVSVNSDGRVIAYTVGMTRITAARGDIAGAAYVAVGGSASTTSATLPSRPTTSRAVTDSSLTESS